MRTGYAAFLSLALLAAAQSAALAAGPDAAHQHGHEMSVVPETRMGVGDKVLHDFRSKNIDLKKKNGYFLDQKGNKVRLSDYRGRVVLMDFIYSGCKHGICQYLNNKMNYIAEKFKDRLGKDLQLVSLSFDETDSPQTLSGFASRWGNDPASWAYLSGLPGDIVDACQEFGVGFHWNDKEGFFEHTVRTVLVDRAGKPVKVYRGREYKIQEAVDDIAAQLKK